MMEVMAAITVIYLLLMLVLFYGYNRFRKQKTSPVPQEYSENLSIVVPFRNEAKILNAFLSQSHLYTTSGVELIMVNDHSEDHSKEIVDKFRSNGVKVIELQNTFGKKAAITAGVSAAVNDYILTTDVDCAITETTIQQIRQGIASKAKMYVLPLKVLRNNFSLATNFFDCEFNALQFATFASLGLGRPLLANGAAIVVERSAYLNSFRERKDMYLPSGDDVFLLHSISKVFGSKAIEIISPEPPVGAAFPASVKNLWKQRLRWVGKTPAVPSKWFLFVAGWVLTTHVVWLMALAAYLVSLNPILVLILAVRPLVDFAVLLRMKSVALNFRFISGFVMVLFYPFYLILLALSSRIIPLTRRRKPILQSKWR